jgi:hypothetical protein
MELQIPAQSQLKSELLADGFKEFDVDFALQATNSDDLTKIVDWIEDYQDEGEVWSEVDWILAGRPTPESLPVTIVSTPKKIEEPKPVEPPPQRAREPQNAQIRFRLPDKMVTYTFQPSQTIGDVIEKLKVDDVQPDATVTLIGQRGSPLTDISKTHAELELTGRVALNVQIT